MIVSKYNTSNFVRELRKMNFKETHVEANRLLSAGVKKKDVFSQLSGRGITNEKLALILAIYADPRRVQANKGLIRALVVIICIQAALGCLVGASSDIGWFWILGGALFHLAIASGIYRNQALAYSGYMLFFLSALHNIFDAFKAAPTSTHVGLALILALTSYAWYVKQRVFPDLAFFSAKKVNNTYVFTDWQANQGPFSSEPLSVSGPFSVGNKSKVLVSRGSEKRKNVWVILSLILYILSLAFIFSSFSTQFDRRWVFDLELVLHCAAVICILFYIFNYRPHSLIVLFKALPILLVAVDIAWWSRYIGMLDSRYVVLIVPMFIIFCLTTAPAWYLCFRFAYIKDIRQ